MKNVFTGYTKIVENETFYFVKKYTAFPELKGVPDFLESFGMHKDFNEACKIAAITDAAIKEYLLSQMTETENDTRVIQMNSNTHLISKSGS